MTDALEDHEGSVSIGGRTIQERKRAIQVSQPTGQGINIWHGNQCRKD